MTNYWIGVASKNHVLLVIQDGFCQLCHGKKAPLIKMKKGDRILYYSPKLDRNDTQPYQKIIAVGTVVDEEVYSFEMAPGFVPFRRNVVYEEGLKEVTLVALNQLTEWTTQRSKLRFGHFEIPVSLYQSIYHLMKEEN